MCSHRRSFVSLTPRLLVLVRLYSLRSTHWALIWLASGMSYPPPPPLRVRFHPHACVLGSFVLVLIRTGPILEYLWIFEIFHHSFWKLILKLWKSIASSRWLHHSLLKSFRRVPNKSHSLLTAKQNIKWRELELEFILDPLRAKGNATNLKRFLWKSHADAFWVDRRSIVF